MPVDPAPSEPTRNCEPPQGRPAGCWGALAAATVAEHALTLTLATLRRLSRWTRTLQVERGWRGPEIYGGISLFGRRVGIHGFGCVARQLVKLLEPFGCDIAAYSHGVPHQLMAEFGVEACDSLEALFERSEVLVEAEALTAVSCRSVTADVLSRLPDGAAFINVGRGGVVDQEALVEAIRSGRLHAGLDVYELEPLPADSPLRSLQNVTLTPHVGGPTIDHRRRCGQRAIDSLKQYAAGEVPQGIITPEIYDRST